MFKETRRASVLFPSPGGRTGGGRRPRRRRERRNGQGDEDGSARERWREVILMLDRVGANAPDGLYLEHWRGRLQVRERAQNLFPRSQRWRTSQRRTGAASSGTEP